jgi:hypothetical protein
MSEANPRCKYCGDEKTYIEELDDWECLNAFCPSNREPNEVRRSEV